MDFGLEDHGYIAPYMGASGGLWDSSKKVAPGFVTGLSNPKLSDTSLKQGLPKSLTSQWSTSPNTVIATVAEAQAGIALQVGVLSGLVALLATKAANVQGVVPQQVFMFGMMSGLGGEVLRELIGDGMNGYLSKAVGQL